VRRVAELYQEGEHWDISRALGDAAPALAELATQRDKGIGQRVRARRQELGLPVATAGKVLPLRASQSLLEPPDALAALDAEPPETEQERAARRVLLGGAAHARGSPRVLDSGASVFDQEVAVCEAAWAALLAGERDWCLYLASCSACAWTAPSTAAFSRMPIS
jgi:hypothetical protein